jgi:hypothetical protein
VQNGRVDIQALTQTTMHMQGGINAFNNWSFTGRIADYADKEASKQILIEGISSYGGGGGLAGGGGLGPFAWVGLWGPAVPQPIHRIEFIMQGATSGYVALYGVRW